MNILTRGTLAAALLVSLTARAQHDLGGMDIGVRSGIDRAEKRRRDRDRIYEKDLARHAKVFLLASVLPHPSIGPLLGEIDAPAIAKELTRLLEIEGFHAVQPGQQPEIVITVDYGRGWLPNPYSDENTSAGRNNLSDSEVFHPWPLHEIFPSLAEDLKRQDADEEKLIIQVRAWKYPPPPDPKKEPLLMWMTTMSISDPDQRRLDDVYKKMLAAGARHFDRPIDREREVIVNDQVPEGHVKLGTPEVVDETKSR